MNKYFILFLCMTLSATAMEQGQSYPWYQSYKNPQFRQVAKERLQRARAAVGSGFESAATFVKRHKAELVALAALIGITVSTYVYTQIFNAFDQNGMNLAQLRSVDKNGFKDSVILGLKAYTMKHRDKKAKKEFMKKHAKETNASGRNALRQIMGLPHSEFGF